MLIDVKKIFLTLIATVQKLKEAFELIIHCRNYLN